MPTFVPRSAGSKISASDAAPIAITALDLVDKDKSMGL